MVSLAILPKETFRLASIALIIYLGYLRFPFVTSCFYFAYTIYVAWEAEISSKRVGRDVEYSPSHKDEPDAISPRVKARKVQSAAQKHPKAFRNASMVYRPLPSIPKEKREHTMILRRTQAARTTNLSGGTSTRLLQDHATTLNMDHIYISFFDFLWGNTFILPSAFLLGVKGVAILMIQQFLVRLGIRKPSKCNKAEIVAKLYLEGMLCINYHSRDGNIAAFCFADFPYINNEGEFRKADLFEVKIDLETKLMVQAKLDDDILTPSEALILTVFYTIFGNHVKLHSLANWGVNVHPQHAKDNPFHARNSLVTVMYNYFGYSSFRRFIPIWKQMGVLSKKWKSESLAMHIDEGIRSGIGAHPNIADLAKYSKLVKFVIGTRAIFLDEFAKHKGTFQGCNGEALFVGTVLHSLDHTMMEWIVEDPLWLDVDCPKFGLMAEMDRIVRMGFVPDLDGLYFHKSFKGSGHPFYESVYKKAARINEDLADHMDTCIIK
eukprot:CAMPEP_0116846758 /NCGR_PEP_ID=MMETSP0418-20121206/14026_1 /TAXON_ID=1158023 /ORGANISM="Astrosyne radiata, Strain 13vi08-1A" /LENGTH=492 /DNA_ID=CAMNT_0004478067 /DNA_START=27 /DNA_END=1505 /DNA_ORIENTATION=-